MRILYIGSKLQHCPGIVMALDRMGYEIAIYQVKVEDMTDDDIERLESFLKKNKVDIVLSNLFSREAAGATGHAGVKYVVWNMDSPAYASWYEEADSDHCYLFYFDYKEYELKKHQGHSNVYHQPLGGDIAWGDRITVTDEEAEAYGCDMSFVGSMYTKNLYDSIITEFPAAYQDIFTGLIEQAAFVWDGQDRLAMPSDLVNEVWKRCPGIFDEPYRMSAGYFLQTFLMGRKLTNVERTLLVEMLSERYDIHLYTRSTEKVPEGVRSFPEVDAGVEALKVFRSSRINLNITLRSILSGVPARVFDVMSVGGFMLSNWQEEIPELFVEDKEIVTYRTPEELVDKADHYLKHEDERARIALNGYQKIKRCYTYEHQLKKILDTVRSGS